MIKVFAEMKTGSERNAFSQLTICNFFFRLSVIAEMGLKMVGPIIFKMKFRLKINLPFVWLFNV